MTSPAQHGGAACPHAHGAIGGGACKPGQEGCAAQDCTGKWGECDANCDKRYIVEKGIIFLFRFSDIFLKNKIS